MAAEVRATGTTTARPRKRAKAAPKPPPTESAAPAALVLFERDGRTWETSAERNFGAALVYLRSIRNGAGTVYAEMGLLDALIGTDETDALLAAVKTRDEWRSVVGLATGYHLGNPEPEATEGN